MSNDSSKQVPTKLQLGKLKPKHLSDKVTWGPRTAILATVLCFVVGQFLAGLLVSLVIILLGWSDARANTWYQTVNGQFSYIVMAEAITVFILLWFLKRQGASVKALGFHRRPVLKDVGFVLSGFAVYFLALIVSTALSKLVGVDTTAEQDLGFNQVIGPLAMLMTFVSLVVLPPLVEESVFRGFLFGGLRRKVTFTVATIVTSVLFALPHLLTGGEGVLLWIAAVDTFVLSVVLCYAREKTGNLWAPIGIHALKNGIAFLYLYVF